SNWNGGPWVGAFDAGQTLYIEANAGRVNRVVCATRVRGEAGVIEVLKYRCGRSRSRSAQIGKAADRERRAAMPTPPPQTLRHTCWPSPGMPVGRLARMAPRFRCPEGL